MENGLTTEVEYVRTIDGDTVEVKVERSFHIRLRDIDVVELRSLHGKEAKDFVENILNNAEKIQVFIPSNDPHKLMDIQSFERIVADIFVDDKNLSDMIRAAGYEKPRS